MSTGLQVLNDAGVEILNTSDPVLIVVSEGDNTTMTSAGVPWVAWPASPVVFVRPKTTEAWVGGYLLTRLGNGNVVVSCSGLFDYVLCASANDWGLLPSGTFGLESFDQNGKILFSSSQRFARIKSILAVNGPYTTTGNPISQSSGFTGFTEMPWIGIQNATWSLPYPAGDSGAASEIFILKINTAINILTVTLSDSLSNGYNQYYNKQMYFPLADISD